MKKILALVLAMLLVLGMTSAFAATKITINRDSTWNSNAETANTTYTLYKIFDAAITTAPTVTASTGASSGGNVVYKISGTDANAAAKVAALPDIFKVNGAAPSATVSAAADGDYYITLANESTTAATIVAALKTMVESNASLFPADSASLTTNASPVEITPAGGDGYYLIVASNGKDLAVQTIGEVTINEKNDYPTIDKKQSKTEANYADDELNVKVGSTIYYEVTVHIPADANKDIVVGDKMSSGLTYNSTAGLTFDPSTIEHSEVASTDAGYNAEATWQIKFTPAQYADYLGQDIKITFSAVVNNNALVDTGRENDVTLTYDNGNYVLKDKVEFDIGAAAIVKYDGATADLNSQTNALSVATGATAIKYLEATFELKDAAGNAVNVKEATTGTNGVYVVATDATSNAVVSDKNHNGVILIYGLEPGTTYTLTETATEGGYNLLSGSVTLTPVVVDKANANATKVTVAEASGVSAGNASADADHTVELTALQVAKVENNQGSTLPSTGGVGTTIFYIGGSILVLAAVILLITKRRMGAND